MNKPLIILSLCFVFAGELEVDGDLKVTGNIEAGTIDSLQQVIAELQAQSFKFYKKNFEINNLSLTHPPNPSEAYNNPLDIPQNSLILDIQFKLNCFDCIVSNGPTNYYGWLGVAITGDQLGTKGLNYHTQNYGGNDYATSGFGWANSETPTFGNYYNLITSNSTYIATGPSLHLVDEVSNLKIFGWHGWAQGSTMNFNMNVEVLYLHPVILNPNAPTYQATEPPQNSRTAQ